MGPVQHIMVVAEAPTLANDLLAWLSQDAYQVTTVTTFRAATAHLQEHPDLVITQLKLGAYNGLHLAFRARSQGIPTVVLGESDPVFERDAAEVGAAYVTTEGLGRERVLSLAQHLIPASSGRRGCPHGRNGVNARSVIGMPTWALDS